MRRPWPTGAVAPKERKKERKFVPLGSLRPARTKQFDVPGLNELLII
jgi:hypothetical protein